MKLTVTVEAEAIAIEQEELFEEVLSLAEAAGYEGELSVAVVDDRRIHELNRRYLDHDEPTDVLAFPLGPGEGEVVVSSERALEEASSREVSPRAELLLYVVHGILHLLGHDDHDPEAARRMHAASLKLLRARGYRNKIALPRGEA